ncbi:MAG: glycine cleavage system aminomethyltransferase GcvT [Clostridia bacterium]|nr:glycine cleavage system aminomethyltransferase GcvT [Clostridia bacterium]
MKKTPLYKTHVELGAKMIDFGGWMMPVQYTGIIEEHNAVRNTAGIFDVSHMGEIFIEGPEALAFADYLVTNDLSGMTRGKVIYSPMCYENGGCVDDVLIYCFGLNKVLLAVNASNIEKDYAWISENRGSFDVSVMNLSDDYAQIAIQGPASQDILQGIAGKWASLSDLGFFAFADGVLLGGREVLISRTGYTGEDGFEVYLRPEFAEQLFLGILAEGKERIKPCGLGARDTLRFESCLPLYGNELSTEISPLQAGLDYFVRFPDREYIGREALQRESKEGTRRRITGFEMIDRGIARHGYDVFDSGGKQIGFVTSGSFCPTLSKNMGLALIESEYSSKGIDIGIGIRDRITKAVTVGKPFYKKKYKKREEIK